MLDSARRHLSMFATAIMLVSLVAFLLSAGPAFGSGHEPAGESETPDAVTAGDTTTLDIGAPMSIEKQIVVTVVGEDAVSYDIAVLNYSPVDTLWLESLIDADLGDLDGRGTCAMPQAILAGAAYRCLFVEWLGGSA